MARCCACCMRGMFAFSVRSADVIPVRRASRGSHVHVHARLRVVASRKLVGPPYVWPQVLAVDNRILPCALVSCETAWPSANCNLRGAATQVRPSVRQCASFGPPWLSG